MSSWYYPIVPFRDRGIDPLRRANLERVRLHWQDDHGSDICVVSDGGFGNDQFNRSRAYNRGVASLPTADGYVFAEADMMISAEQISEAIEIADRHHGLVVPFTDYHYLTPAASKSVRIGSIAPERAAIEYSMGNRRSIGAINVVSRLTMSLIGRWDESFDGNWYDDDAMKIAFEACGGETRFVDGPAYHLYHLPGHRGSHLSPEDRAATARNKARFGLYQQAARTGDKARIRQLTGGSR